MIKRFKSSIKDEGDNAVSGSTTLSDIKVYAYSNAAFSNTIDTSADGTAYTGGQIVDTITVAPGNVGTDTELQLNNALQIPAGATYYFKVTGVGTITAGTGTTANNYVKTYIQGDAAFPTMYNTQLMASTTRVDADTNDDFIWSPYASSTIGVNAEDWTNGYKVDGLPADGMEAETITQ